MTAELPGSRLSEPLAVLRQITAQMTVSRDVGEVLTAITSALVTTAEVALARIWLYESAARCVTCLSRGAGVEPTPRDFSLHLAASAGLSTRLDGGPSNIARSPTPSNLREIVQWTARPIG